MLFASCMGGLAACSNNDKKPKKVASPVTKVEPPREGTVKRLNNIAKVTQIARTFDGVKVTGKLVADNAVSKEFLKNFRGNSTRADVRVAEHILREPQRKVEGGTLYNGTTWVNGVSVDYLIYADDYAPVVVEFIAKGGNITKAAFLTLGKKASGLSKIPAGTHDYTGYNLIFGKREEYGKFDMTVDFSKAHITTFDATMRNSKVTGTNIRVNLDHGTFKGDVTLSGAFVGKKQDGEVYGDFHGVGATGVSGICDNVSAGSEVAGSELVYGLFAGSKQ